MYVVPSKVILQFKSVSNCHVGFRPQSVTKRLKIYPDFWED